MKSLSTYDDIQLQLPSLDISLKAPTNRCKDKYYFFMDFNRTVAYRHKLVYKLCRPIMSNFDRSLKKKAKKKLVYSVSTLVANCYLQQYIQQFLQHCGLDFEIAINVVTTTDFYTRKKHPHLRHLSHEFFVNKTLYGLRDEGYLKIARGFYNKASVFNYPSSFIPTQKMLDLLDIEYSRENLLYHFKDSIGSSFFRMAEKKELVELRNFKNEPLKNSEKTYRTLLNATLHSLNRINLNTIIRVQLITNQDTRYNQNISDNRIHNNNNKHTNTNSYISGTRKEFLTQHGLLAHEVIEECDDYSCRKRLFISESTMTFQNRFQFHSVFNNDWDHGGRLYASGQNFRKELRPSITFNGENCVELDYSGLHLKLLYARKGHNYTGDPYAIDIPQWKDKKTLRKMFKFLALIFINAADKKEAEGAIKKSLGKKLHMRLPKGVKLIMLTDAFIDKHEMIKEYFFSGVGTELQNEDKDLALHVVEGFVKAERPLIPMHDGFVCAQSDAQLLYNLMHEAYLNQAGFKPIIKAEYGAEIEELERNRLLMEAA